MPENNKENCDKLANKCVESWDMNALVSYAGEMLSVELQTDNDLFNETWEEMGINDE